jgi:hypothetical protein
MTAQRSEFPVEVTMRYISNVILDFTYVSSVQHEPRHGGKKQLLEWKQPGLVKFALT